MENPVLYAELRLSTSCCFERRAYSPYLHSIQKRSVDLVLCLILLAPVCIFSLVIIFLVLILDGSPAVFFQKRAGQNGAIFTMPKIRTLRKEAHPNTPSYCHDLEALMFPLGKRLRKYRLDELPQIFSVISGKMSFVGPRPELVHVAESYTGKEVRRLWAKPGLTGLWQVRASRDEPIHHNIQYDLYYLRKASLWLDMKIFAETFFYLIKV